MKQRFLKGVVACSLLILGGCTTLEQANVPYERPALPAKPDWSEPARKVASEWLASPKEIIEPDWWRAFGDPTLSQLIEQAIVANPDLLIAASRVKEAEARYRIDSGARVPSVSLGMEGEYLRYGGDSNATESLYGLGARVNWEVDVWGRLNKRALAAAAGQQANEAAWRATWLKVASTVARSYFRLRRYDEEIQLHQGSVQFAADSLRMFNARVAAGFSTRLEVHSQEAELSRLKREMMELTYQRRTMENRLTTLLGEPAGTRPIANGSLREIVRPRRIPRGLPAELIARRPDVVAAEYGVLQAHELLGSARLEKLPGFSIGGSAGGSSTVFGRMLDTWTLGLTSGIRLPVYNPAIGANIDLRQAQSQRSVDTYKNTVLVAYEEVENALAGLHSRQQQQGLLEEQVSTLTEVAAQRQGQLRAGLISQLELFEAERSRVSAARNRLLNYESLLQDTVTLYETLGGGWEPHLLRVSER